MTLLKGQRPRKPLEFDLMTYEMAARWFAAYLSGPARQERPKWAQEAA